MSNNSIPYGLLNNQYVIASDLSDGAVGVNCNCYCPQCKKPLELVHRKGKRYFRHAKYHEHCHFQIDQHTLQFIADLLKESGFLEVFGLTLDDLSYFSTGIKVESFFNNEESIQNENINPQTIINEKDNRFKLTLKNKKYSIKLFFKTNNRQLENNVAIIDVEDIFKGKGAFVENKKEVLEGMREKLKDSISYIMEKDERVRKQRQKEEKEKEIKERLRELKEVERIEKEAKMKPELNQIIKKKGPILRYYDKTCPICGARMCSMKMRIGTSVVCENYPECDYIAGNYD